MEGCVSAEEFARWFYKVPDGAELSESERKGMNRRCREGSVRGAFKIGRKWFVNVEEATYAR